MASLTFLRGGVLCGGVPVAGGRAQALLAALATAEGRTVRASALVDAVWGDAPPANAAKALQVLVSRTRTTCGPDTVVHDGDGYRLGPSPDEVDCLRLAALAAEARRALDRDAGAAGRLAAEAAALADGLPAPEDGDGGPLAGLLRRAAADRAAAALVGARAQARQGDAAALPHLQAAWDADGTDESLLADLLTAEADGRGPAAALERFEAYRRHLREDAGAEPGADLQRVQRALLAADRPVREGVRFDATELLGRDGDVRALRGLLETARVVSVVGPGGLGKTRLAHVLARTAPQPVVWVVELVGVTDPDAVVAEVGSALGVRDSVTGRRTLTPAQRADLRGRIAGQLGQAPSLLVLDNCEHLVEAVAALVAFLVTATPDLRVLTTTRAPLQIAAEHVYRLGELAAGDARELFERRARAVRPDVRLDEEPTRRVVARLDGLPLAIELAAAKARTMTVADIDRRLEDRFRLLRGGDRGAPDRHRTLHAVIDWSWNLLEAPEQGALRRLSVFHDGFTLDAAEAVAGSDAADTVARLADQSLVTLRESADGVRHRMLETVREFGRAQLAAAGEEAAARAAHRAWAVAYAAEHGRRLFGPGELPAIDALAAEEANLADALRVALDDEDPAAVAQLAATLGGFWTMRGQHGQVLVRAGSVSAALRDWSPPAALADVARSVALVWLVTAMMALDDQVAPLRELLARLDAVAGGDRRLAAWTRVMGAWDPDDSAEFAGLLEALSADDDREVARVALFWASHLRENAGDVAGATALAERALALTRPDDGAWTAASLQSHLGQLAAAGGRPEAAIAYATAGLPTLDRLQARDDRMQSRALIAVCATTLGRLEEARTRLAEIDAAGDLEVGFGGTAYVGIARAELAFAEGDVTGGLAHAAALLTTSRALAFPGFEATGTEPWVLLPEAWALAVLVQYGEDPDQTAAQAARCATLATGALGDGRPFADLPALGLLLFALGRWRLAENDAEVGVELLALAHGLNYTRAAPTLTWETAAALAEKRAPGRLDAALAAVPRETAALRERVAAYMCRL